MKRNLFVLALFSALCLQTNASVTVEQVTEPEYVINSGYSEQFAEEVAISKQRANGKPAEPLYDKHRNRFVNFWRNVYGYLDPSWDTEERIHHDINPCPNWRDL